MWFVLQNQLLVSYSSKENYDTKLVSFKDALNLMPGTIVKPFGAFRFTIEMPSNVLYTFVSIIFNQKIRIINNLLPEM